MDGKQIVRFALGLSAIGVVLWLSAGTLDYWQGWAYFVLAVVTNVALAAFLARTDPILPALFGLHRWAGTNLHTWVGAWGDRDR